MIRTTPFHPRLSELNSQGLYTHWQGHLSALRYTHAPKHEYFAVRNSVGIFDTSPLFKYRIHGPDAEQFLAGVLVRDSVTGAVPSLVSTRPKNGSDSASGMSAESTVRERGPWTARMP